MEAIQSSDDVIPEATEEEQNEDCDDHSCHDCKKKRQIALLDKLPHAVGTGEYSHTTFPCASGDHIGLINTI